MSATSLTRATQALRRHLKGGFTLIEISTVSLVMLALLAIAVPTFLEPATSAANRRAQLALRATVISGETRRATNNGQYTATVAQFQALEPQFEYVDLSTAPSATGANYQVSISAAGTTFRAVAITTQGRCFSVLRVINGASSGLWFGELVSPTTCTAGSVTAGNTALRKWPA